MPITFINNNQELDQNVRVLTDYRSLDNALGNNRNEIGWPMQSMVEVSGREGVGKTAFVSSIAAVLASKMDKTIDFVDFERQSLGTLETILRTHGYDNKTVNIIRVLMEKDKKEKDRVPMINYEKSLGNLLDDMYCGNPPIGILDSIAATLPARENNGEIGDATYGARAVTIGSFSLRLSQAFLANPSQTTVLCTNHQHENIGSQGYNTSGGRTKEYMIHTKMRLKRVYSYDYTESGGWLLEGLITKNRDGYAGRPFYVFIVGGEGINANLTAVFECVMKKLATVDGGKLSMDGQPYGFVKRLIGRRDDNDLFAPFHNALMAEQTDTESDDGSLNEADSIVKDVKTVKKVKKAKGKGKK